MASDVERIKERLPVEEVIGSYVQLQKSGNQFKARCPFHTEKTASFYVSPDRGTYYCFGCGQKGDIITFIQEYERLDFGGALRMLADRAGITLSGAPAARPESKKLVDDLYTVLERAAAFYERQLTQHEQAVRYLKDRGLNEETIKTWRIGFAPDAWSELADAARKSGTSLTLLEKAGLIRPSEKKPGLHLDRFRSRIMFPLFDKSGRVVGFSGRIFGEGHDQEAKYINSPETELFKKSKFLFGLHRAAAVIRSTRSAYLVEGQMDLIACHQVGLTHAVATSGTAYTSDHAGMLARYADTVTLAFDHDTAGVKATLQALKISLRQGLEVMIMAMADPATAKIKEVKDPADMLKDHQTEPELVRDTLLMSEPWIEWLMRQYASQVKRDGYLETEVLPVCASIKSDIVRDRMTGEIARRTGIGYAIVKEKVDSERNKLNLLADQSSGTQSGEDAEGDAAPLVHAKSRIDVVEDKLVSACIWFAKSDKEKAAAYMKEIELFCYDIQLPDEYIRMHARFAEPDEALLMQAEALFSGSEQLEAGMAEIRTAFYEELLKKRLQGILERLSSAETRQNAEEISKLLSDSKDISGRLHRLKK